MEVLVTYTRIEIKEAVIPFSSMPDPQPAPLEGTDKPYLLDFVILKPNGIEEADEAYQKTYCEEHGLRYATGFELASLHQELCEIRDGNLTRESQKNLATISQTIALGDIHQGQFVFVADGFWEYMLSITEKRASHFKIATVRLAPA